MTKVIIVGAGLGGLALAHKLLANPAIEVIILERDASSSARNQGIVIGLRQEGVDALVSLGFASMLESIMTKDGPSDVLMRAGSGLNLFRGRGFMKSKVNGRSLSVLIPRATLRVKLAQALPQQTIRWNSRVMKIHQQGDKVMATLETGEVIEGDILVGADGARSVIRQQFFPHLVPSMLGLYNSWGTIPESSFGNISNLKLFRESRRALVRTNGSHGCSIMCFVYLPSKDSPGEQAVLFWSMSMPNQLADAFAKPDSITKDQLKAEFIKIVEKCFSDEEVRIIVANSEDFDKGYEMTSVLPQVYAAKSICVNDERKNGRVTLLGDAAHKTTTQAGLGATGAFLDAIDLGNLILEHQQSVTPQVLREYETKMCTRASWVVGASYGNTMRIHVVKGPGQTFIQNGLFYVIGCIADVVQLTYAFLTLKWLF